jgi:site-specific DNA recombinase
MENKALPGVLERVNTNPPKQVVPLKYCLYARKSTEQEEKQILSIDSQIKEMLQIAEREGLDVVETKRESHSAKASGQRPVFNEIITEIRSGKFNAILTWAPDRCSRNAGDLGILVDLMDQGRLIEIRTYGQKFINSPNEKFLLMILCSQAKLENDNKSVNVKRGLRTRVEMGLWPGCAPTGYLNEKRTDRKCCVIPDPNRAKIVKTLFEKVGDSGWSGRQVWRWLNNEMKFTTKNGKEFGLSNLYLMLRNSFYYGVYEYPRKSGNWYTGQHTPLITKDLFERVQQKLDDENSIKMVKKEFAFTRLIICGLCGGGITADEKFKTLKDGTTSRHVYYGCTRRKDLDCQCGYINEDDLIEQLVTMIDKIDLSKIGIKAKIEKELERYNGFRLGVLKVNEQEKIKQKDIDIRNYAKYVLTDGTIFEKRDLLACLKSRLILKDKKLRLTE